MGNQARLAVVVSAAIVTAVGAAWGVNPGTKRVSGAIEVPANRKTSYQALGGAVWIEFDKWTLDELGWEIVASGWNGADIIDDPVEFPIQSSSTLAVEAAGSARQGVVVGRAQTHGGLMLLGLGERIVIGNLTVGPDSEGLWTVRSTLGQEDEQQTVFDLASVMTDFSESELNLRVVGELSVAQSWAEELGLPEAAGVVIGLITMDADLVRRSAPLHGDKKPQRAVRSVPVEADSGDGGEAAGVTGPDILVADLMSIARFGRVGDITAYAVGTNACNIGDERANWIRNTNQHPVIVMNMYRLKDGRFEQIGMSWVKHGFYAISGGVCGPCRDPTDGTQLGVGCSDPYSASLNGAQNNMSMRSDVNAHTGYFPYPWSAPPPEPTIGKRLQVHDADIDPDLNEGALYFVQGHYIAADDAAAGNNNNNASYRRVLVSEPAANQYDVRPTDQTQRGQPAIRAWQDYDPSVIETDVQVPDEGLFILSSKVTNLGTGFWHYEYALQNLNSDRSAGAFSIPLPRGTLVENIGFHDVDYHSGEPYDLTDWEVTVEGGAITWSTDSYDVNPNANALRFSTLYNFRFDANAEPEPMMGTAVITLFKPGDPPVVAAEAVVPSINRADCNDNGLPDACDVDCNALGCAEPCGGSLDCNENGVPDECEVPPLCPTCPDCNANQIPDSCDIVEGTSDDCQPNGVPDDCEPDCDGDGIPDTCDPPQDCDADGVDDCNDLCMCSSAVAACLCPEIDRCCWDSGFCLPDYPREACIEQGGTPDCTEPPCIAGCMYAEIDGDSDRDQDRDIFDVGGFFTCFTGPSESPGFVEPSLECRARFDFDRNRVIDLNDFKEFMDLGMSVVP